MGDGCGGLDEGKCLESGTNSGRSADVGSIDDSSRQERISEREECLFKTFRYCNKLCPCTIELPAVQ